MYNKSYERDVLSGEIKRILASEAQANLKVCHQYLVSFPDENEHENHLCGESASLVQSLDERLKKHLRTLVWEHNITSGPQMRVLLEVHLKESLFKGEPLPEKINKRFWPSKRDIQNHIALAIKKQRNSNVDQEIVADLVDGWKKEHSNDHFLLRLKDDVDDVEDTADESVDSEDDMEDEVLLRQDMTNRLYGSKKKLLYIHQTQWQQRLMARYGQEISLLDATYRTTRYSLPLYFICVPTNVGYINVATFITETEDGESLKEALGMIKEWNPHWSPKYFMCDYAEEEINSLESVFPESFVYLCDFHREQSWDRWLSASHNGLTSQKSDVLQLLRAIAKSFTEEDFFASLSALKESFLWKKNQKLRNWLERKWLKCCKRWVRAYRQERFNVSVNTNNGIERQNLALKYEYLDMKKARSLSQLLSILVNKFLPDSYTRYKRLNVVSSDLYKSYDVSIPPFLHNRPKFVVQHCYRRWMEGQNITSDDIDKTDDYTFLVKSVSQADKGRYFEVCFQNSGNGLPSCQCMDWNNWHLPCKHFMAVFSNHEETSWETLPDSYTNSPYLTLDIEECHSAEFPIVEDNLLEAEDKPKSSSTALPISNSAALKRQRSKVCGLLEILRDHVYQTSDVAMLESASVTLETLITEVREVLPQEGNLILDEDSNMLHIGTNSKKKNRKSKPLKKHKRKSLAKRHGAAAERVRTYYTKKGAHDLLDSGKSHQNVVEEGIDLLLDANPDSAEPPQNTSDILLEKFKGFVDNLSEEQWKFLCSTAVSSETETIDMTSMIGSAIMHQYCDPDKDSVDVVVALQSHLPHAVKDLSNKAKYRLICLLLEKMDQDGCIQVPGEHPRQLELEGRKAFRDLTECMKRKEKKKSVTFSKDVLQKKKNVPLLFEDRTSAFPSGGLQNLPGKNLCFANSLMQCLRITDLHKILLQHTCSDDGCFVCELKFFIEEGPISAEALCGNMQELWPEYAVGQQQDPHEFLQKILGEIQNKCFGSEDGDIAAQDVFYGLQRSTVKCQICHQSSSKLERYTGISVSIEKVDDVTAALREHFAEEKVQFVCSRCGSNSLAAKETKLLQVPKNVIIQLKRFSSSRKKNQ
ncbi:uncharacterized protein [Argopecten irradians]|uniref:uncharacterized protein n=1 Tax=Argopecten irradians TaxID=31199 RepID=UPI0037207F8B